VTVFASRQPQAAYFECLRTADSAAATDLVLGLVDEGQPVDWIVDQVLVPAQVRVGELWERGQWSVADEHVASSVTEAALAALTDLAVRRRVADSMHVVIACVEGEWHTLPIRMAATTVALAGLRVTTLGPSLPAEHLTRRLEAGDVDVLALSCSIPTNLLGAARMINAGRQAGVPVVVGGGAFGTTSRRAYALGADAWVPSAADIAGGVPVSAGRTTEISVEAMVLDAIDDQTLGLAYDRLLSMFPALGSMSPFQQARTREDLRWIARYTGAAVLTGDSSVLTDFLAWLRRLVDTTAPGAVISAAALIVADTIEPIAPEGAHVLTLAAAGVS
jgi:methanogenic corrinoid protein MtbC1